MGAKLQLLGLAFGLSFIAQRYSPTSVLGVVCEAILLFVTEFVIYLAWTILIYPRYFSPLRKVILAPKSNFWTGQTLKIMRSPTGQPMREWIDSVPNDGLIKYRMWGAYRICPTTPQALSEVLVQKNYDFIKPPNLVQGIGRLLGVGILLAEGDEHKRQRKNLMPAFNFRHIKNLYPLFWQKSEEMTACLSEAARSTNANMGEDDEKSVETSEKPKHAPGVIDVGEWASRATLDIIGMAGMGHDFNSLHDSQNELNSTYRTVFQPNKTARMMGLLGLFLPFWFLRNLPVKHNSNINAASDLIKQVCRDLIAEKRAKMQEKERTEVDIVSVALESGGFSDEDLVNQMMTFLAAGHETTATAMVWAIFDLCRNQGIQQKLRDEVRSKLPSPDGGIAAADIDNCHYLQAVCSEVLRLNSPVSTTLRIAACDTSIGDQFVPKGTLVVLSPWAVNTSKQLWGEDAHEFKPERWLDADGKSNNKGGADSNFSFLTFLHGPRSCIGQKFAVAEFACLIAAWIGRFETEFEDESSLKTGEPDIAGGITAKPKGGVWVKLREVGGW